MTRAFLGLGANLGDRLAGLQAAVDHLAATGGITVLASSDVYETAPIGPPQPDYLNAVVEIETTLEPRELLRRCLEIEAVLGRERGERWGARTIDIDLLRFDDLAMDEDDLVLPHPRMHERAFVLIPLADLTGAAAAAGVDPSGVRRWGQPLAVPSAS